MTNYGINKSNPIEIKTLVSIFFILFALLGTSGCATILVKSPYTPTYIEKTSFLEDKIAAAGPVSLILLPFKDNRKNKKDPYKVYKQVKLDNVTLANYLYDALVTDLTSIGIEVIGIESVSNGDKLRSIEDIKLNGTLVDSNARHVMGIEIFECIPDYEMKMITVVPYSQYDFQISVWNVHDSKIVYEQRLTKTLMGKETGGATFEAMVGTLLNSDLSTINMDIAEILVNL